MICFIDSREFTGIKSPDRWHVIDIDRRFCRTDATADILDYGISDYEVLAKCEKRDVARELVRALRAERQKSEELVRLEQFVKYVVTRQLEGVKS